MSLARLVASRAVFGFQWHGLFWVPMFQFDRVDLSARTSNRRIIEELSPRTMAGKWLRGSSGPTHGSTDAALSIASIWTPGRVLKAASEERFVATG